MRRLTRIARIDGVDVHIHWSAFAVGGLFVLSSLPSPGGTLVAIAAFLGILMVHEWGHVVAARRRRCVAWSIEIYPFIGFTRFSAPASYFDECVIAWGGVLAQFAVAAPLLLLAAIFGSSTSEVSNAVVGVFGYFSVFIAIVNLLPARGLDGAKAWRLIPMLVARGIGAYLKRGRRAPRPAGKDTWVH